MFLISLQIWVGWKALLPAKIYFWEQAFGVFGIELEKLTKIVTYRGRTAVYSAKCSTVGRICAKDVNATCNNPMVFNCSHQETHFCETFALQMKEFVNCDFNSELPSTERFEPPSVRVFSLRSRISIWLCSVLLVVAWLYRDSFLSGFFEFVKWYTYIMAGKEQTVSELANDKWIGAFVFMWTP